MAIGLLGRKVGMTQIFDEARQVVPVTVIEAGPCHVLQVRTSERDGYEAVQLGFLDKPRRLASRSQRGHVAKLDSKRAKARAKAGVEPLPKADCEPQRFVREFRGSIEGLTVGQKLDVESFRRRQARRRHRHHQGPRHRRRDGAAQLPRPAGHARREEGASSRRLDRPEPVPRPRAQGPPDGRPATATSAARCAI